MKDPSEYLTIRAYFETDRNGALDAKLVPNQQSTAARIGAPTDTCFITTQDRPVRISEISKRRQRLVVRKLNDWLKEARKRH